MHCPYCKATDTKVIDSRLADEGNQVRRRRECLACNERFSTYEAAELILPRIVKSNDSREEFDEDKLRISFHKALEKRSVSEAEIDQAISNIRRALRESAEREVSSGWIGELVMLELKKMDQVAYVRYASVYRSFEDINQFLREIEKLVKRGN